MEQSSESKIGELIEPQPDGCWHFTGQLSNGYGVVWDGVSQVLAHRYVYDLLVGAIPDGLELHHKCEVRHCVNPAHLIPLSRAEHAAEHRKLRAAAKVA